MSAWVLTLRIADKSMPSPSALAWVALMFFFAFSAAKFPVPKIYYGKPTMYIMRQIEDSGQYVISVALALQ